MDTNEASKRGFIQGLDMAEAYLSEHKNTIDDIDLAVEWCHEADENHRQYVEFSFLACEFDDHDEIESEELWEAYEDSLSEGIQKGLTVYQCGSCEKMYFGINASRFLQHESDFHVCKECEDQFTECKECKQPVDKDDSPVRNVDSMDRITEFYVCDSCLEKHYFTCTVNKEDIKKTTNKYGQTFLVCSECKERIERTFE